MTGNTPSLPSGTLQPLLREMRDIAPPPEAPLWPPAPGWWLLALLTILSLLFLGYHRYRRRALRRAALAALKRLEAEYRNGGDAPALLQGLSILLRRVALARAPRRQIAGLHGPAWLEWLDRQGRTHGFRRGPGAILLHAPYRRHAEIPELPALLELIRTWICNTT